MNKELSADEYCKGFIAREHWKILEWPKHQERLKRCTSFLEGYRFADIGCICGHGTNKMKKFKPGEWWAIDFSHEAVNKGATIFPDIQFVYSSSSFALAGKYHEYFDSVVCAEVIEHVPDDHKFAGHIISLAKSVIVFTTPNRPIKEPGHLRVYNREMLAALAGNYKNEIYSEGDFWFLVIKKMEVNR